MNMLGILLSLFDAPGGYKSATIACALQLDGITGLDYGAAKAIILDAMKILPPLWEGVTNTSTPIWLLVVSAR